MEKRNVKTKRATVVEVAQKAGVSVSTASRVFDPKWEGRIKNTTKEAVLAAAQSLGYVGTNALVRGFQGGRTNIVALVVGSTTGYFYLEVIMKFVRSLREAGRQVMIFEADVNNGIENIVNQVQQYQVDAIIITAAATSSAIIDCFLPVDIPVVVFNRPVQNSNFSTVYCDGRAAAQKVADFLMDHGHKNFAVISGDANLSKEQKRTEGFIERVQERAGCIVQVLLGDYTYESGYELTCELLKEHRPDAIFCGEDTIAMGAMDAARECFGLRVPEDISIMGFDNTSVSRFHSYSLTTVKHPVKQMIESTISMMDQLIEAPQKQMERIYDMEIVVRGSVKL